MKQKIKRGNQGFSLVELIIVIAIMAVLVGVLAPQYIKYVEKSRKSKDDQHADSLLNAAHIIVADVDYFEIIGDDIKIEFTNTGTTVQPNDVSFMAGMDEFLSGWGALRVQSKFYQSKKYVVEVKHVSNSFNVIGSWQ